MNFLQNNFLSVNTAKNEFLQKEFKKFLLDAIKKLFKLICRFIL